jgi:hypothetical protein
MGRMPHPLISDLRGYLIADKFPFLGCRKHSDLQTAIRKFHPRVVKYGTAFPYKEAHAYIVVKIAYLAIHRVYTSSNAS